MDRKEIGVCRQYPDAADSSAVIAVTLPIPVETRSAGAADEAAQNGQGVGEKRPAGLQLIVAALLVVVAERRKDRRGRKRLLELLPEELHRLSHKHSIGGIRMVAAPRHRIPGGSGARGNRRISARRPACGSVSAICRSAERSSIQLVSRPYRPRLRSAEPSRTARHCSGSAAANWSTSRGSAIGSKCRSDITRTCPAIAGAAAC